MTPSQSSAIVLAVCAWSHAVAADPLRVTTTGAVPFAVPDLEAALALRARMAAPGATSGLDARVIADGADVRIVMLGRERRVPLEGEAGDAAARLVAFAILDLAGDALDPPEADAAPGPVPRAVTPPAEPTTAIVAVARPARRDVRWSLAAWGIAGTRQEAALELGIGLVGRVRVFGSFGAGLARTTETSVASAADLERSGYPARLGFAWRRGRIELRASAIAILERASIERASTELLVGGGGAVVWVQRIGPAALLVGAGADGFVTAADYRVHDMHVARSERVAGWAGVGIAVERAR